MNDRVRGALVYGAPVGLGFVVTLGAAIGLIAAAGTDIPFYDQWEVEGRWLYPTWIDGTFRWVDLARVHNEHRIAWTNLLNLVLFTANGQWDPLVQQVAGAVLRASLAAGLIWKLGRGCRTTARTVIAAAVVLALLPAAAWHNALWGFQTQVMFAVGFALISLSFLSEQRSSAGRTLAGLLAGVAGLLAMAPAALIGAAVLAVVMLRWIERRTVRLQEAWPGAALLLAAVALRGSADDHAALVPTATQFIVGLGRALAWPHTAQPLAAIVMNLPLGWAVGARILRHRRAAPGEDYVVAFGAWAAGVAIAAAWARGGGAEWTAGVPSRYADFLVLLPLANGWCAVQLAREQANGSRLRARVAVLTWVTFLAIGWMGLTTEMARRVIIPRARDREAPIRLAIAFQRSGDVTVFENQPRLLVPHPNPTSLTAVLNDPRLAGALPPSLQPNRPLGPLSRVVRRLLGHR